jgi:hypothetical protein
MDIGNVNHQDNMDLHDDILKPNLIIDQPNEDEEENSKMIPPSWFTFGSYHKNEGSIIEPGIVRIRGDYGGFIFDTELMKSYAWRYGLMDVCLCELQE